MLLLSTNALFPAILGLLMAIDLNDMPRRVATVCKFPQYVH